MLTNVKVKKDHGLHQIRRTVVYNQGELGAHQPDQISIKPTAAVCPIQNKNLLPVFPYWQQVQTGEGFTIVYERMRATERAGNITDGEICHKGRKGKYEPMRALTI